MVIPRLYVVLSIMLFMPALLCMYMYMNLIIMHVHVHDDMYCHVACMWVCLHCRVSNKLIEMAESKVKIKAASEALRVHFSALVKTIDPLMVAIELYSKKAIDDSTLDRITSVTSTAKYEKACQLLKAVSDAVKTNPDVFGSFCAVLESEPVTEERAKLLKGR